MLVLVLDVKVAAGSNSACVTGSARATARWLRGAWTVHRPERHAQCRPVMPPSPLLATVRGCAHGTLVNFFLKRPVWLRRRNSEHRALLSRSHVTSRYNSGTHGCNLPESCFTMSMNGRPRSGSAAKLLCCNALHFKHCGVIYRLEQMPKYRHTMRLVVNAAFTPR